MCAKSNAKNSKNSSASSCELTDVSSHMVSTYVSLIVSKELDKIQFDMFEEVKHACNKVWGVISKINEVIKILEMNYVDEMLEDIRINYINDLRNRMYSCYDILERLREFEYKPLLEYSVTLYTLYHPDYEAFITKLKAYLEKNKKYINHIIEDYDNQILFYDDYAEEVGTLFDTLHKSCIHIKQQAVMTHNLIYSGVDGIPVRKFHCYPCECHPNMTL